MTDETNNEHFIKYASYFIAGAGSLGIGLQNYQAVDMLLKSITSASQYTHAAAFLSGGICSGAVNFNMNVDLLNDFFQRFNPENQRIDPKTGEIYYINPKTITPETPEGIPYYLPKTAEEKFQYYGGIAIFSITGILFGLMAFTFAMESPLAILALAVGLFVTVITVLQEIEAWLQSFDATNTYEITTWSEYIGHCFGYLITWGNILALSLGFSLGLASSLMALHVAALPAVITGFSVAFTAGLFTEYYFYSQFLPKFCAQFEKNWAAFIESPLSLFGFFCISVNALVNAALAYTALELLTTLLIAASISLPPAAAITALSVFSAFFVGSASFLLGMDFWTQKPEEEPIKTTSGVSTQGIFSHIYETMEQGYEACFGNNTPAPI